MFKGGENNTCAGSSGESNSVSSKKKIKIIHNINLTPGKSNILFSLLQHTKQNSETSHVIVDEPNNYFENVNAENSIKLEILPNINKNDINSRLKILQEQRTLCSLNRARVLKQISVLKKNKSVLRQIVSENSRKIKCLDKANQHIRSEINNVTFEIEKINFLSESADNFLESETSESIENIVSESVGSSPLESDDSESFLHLVTNSEPIEMSLTQLTELENNLFHSRESEIKKQLEMLKQKQETLNFTQRKRSELSYSRAQSQNKIRLLEKDEMTLKENEIECSKKITQIQKEIENIKCLLELC